MSMTVCAYHLGEAATALAEAARLIDVARHHVADAEPHDVDPDAAGQVYTELGKNLPRLTGSVLLAGQWCEGLVTSRQPDLDRERAEIDAERDTPDDD